MKVGAMNNPRKNLLSETESIAEMGFDFLDLTVEYPEATPDKIRANLPAFKDILSTSNLSLVGHMPWFLNIIHPYEGVRKATLTECETIFDMCAELGIDHVTIHPDFQRFKREHRQVIKETITSLKTLSKSAQDRSLTLCLENFEEDYFSVENLKEIFNSVEKLKFTLDVGHAFMRVKKTDNIAAMIAELAPRLTHVHMHDNHGFRDEHLPLGVGNVEFQKIVAALKTAGYDGTITLEVHTEDSEYLTISKRKLKNMWSQ